ncbi:MAG TPA: hypothetical protein VEB01_16580 [Methylocaldum sp.]|nr:hypothetical protein [Methylocaldum sp.]
MPNPPWLILQPRLRELLLPPLATRLLRRFGLRPFRHNLDSGQDGGGEPQKTVHRRFILEVPARARIENGLILLSSIHLL